MRKLLDRERLYTQVYALHHSPDLASRAASGWGTGAERVDRVEIRRSVGGPEWWARTAGWEFFFSDKWARIKIKREGAKL